MLVTPLAGQMRDDQTANTQALQNRNNLTQASVGEEESKVIASGDILSRMDNTPLLLRGSEGRGMNRYSSEQPANESSSNLVLAHVVENASGDEESKVIL